MKLKDQVLNNEELVLNDIEVNMLGPQLTLNGCTVASYATAKALSFVGVSIVDSTFISKVALSDFQWCKTDLKGVKFIGQYSGCDFGRWKEFHGENGAISNCDFSEAKLDNCRFMNCDISTLTFPKWPCFTILNPREKAEAIQLISWPGKLGLIMGIFADSPEGCVAVTGNAKGLLKRLGGSELEFKAALQQLEEVIC